MSRVIALKPFARLRSKLPPCWASPLFEDAMILPGDAPASIAQAAQALANGELVGFPTETVYGLGADAGSDTAVAKIFAAKGRPSDHPLIVHVADAQGVHDFACDIPDFATKLMAQCWPGPLTLILPRREGIGLASAGGQNAIGVRCPSHPVALSLLKAARGLGVLGVSGPSANRFGRVSPTTAQHVANEFDPSLLILDGGPCPVGIESSIVDCTRSAPVLLRPGMLSSTQLSQLCGQPVLSPQAFLHSRTPRASGTLASHYAPNAKVRLLETHALALAMQHTSLLPGQRIGVWIQTLPAPAEKHWVVRSMAANPQACAQALFATLREFEALGVAEIWIQAPPAGTEWDGIRDRLERAAAPSIALS
jgi:L-threonylcarbamoyladenylate synthase